MGTSIERIIREMKSVSNQTVAVLCRVLPILIEAVRHDRNVKVANAARMAWLVLRKLRKI